MADTPQFKTIEFSMFPGSPGSPAAFESRLDSSSLTPGSVLMIRIKPGVDLDEREAGLVRSLVLVGRKLVWLLHAGVSKSSLSLLKLENAIPTLISTEDESVSYASDAWRATLAPIRQFPLAFQLPAGSNALSFAAGSDICFAAIRPSANRGAELFVPVPTDFSDAALAGFIADVSNMLLTAPHALDEKLSPYWFPAAVGAWCAVLVFVATGLRVVQRVEIAQLQSTTRYEVPEIARGFGYGIGEVLERLDGDFEIQSLTEATDPEKVIEAYSFARAVDHRVLADTSMRKLLSLEHASDEVSNVIGRYARGLLRDARRAGLAGEVEMARYKAQLYINLVDGDPVGIRGGMGSGNLDAMRRIAYVFGSNFVHEDISDIQNILVCFGHLVDEDSYESCNPLSTPIRFSSPSLADEQDYYEIARQTRFGIADSQMRWPDFAKKWPQSDLNDEASFNGLTQHMMSALTPVAEGKPPSSLSAHRFINAAVAYEKSFPTSPLVDDAAFLRMRASLLIDDAKSVGKALSQLFGKHGRTDRAYYVAGRFVDAGRYHGLDLDRAELARLLRLVAHFPQDAPIVKVRDALAGGDQNLFDQLRLVFLSEKQMNTPSTSMSTLWMALVSNSTWSWS